MLVVRIGTSRSCNPANNEPSRQVRMKRLRLASASGHVYGPAPWQELSDVFAALVGCGHVSGLLVRQVWPLALMLCADRVPILFMHLEVR